MRFRAAVLVGVCLLTACSKSSSSQSTTTKTIGNSVPLSPPATTPVVPIAPAACSLVTPAQIKKILGVAAVPAETDQGAGSKGCTWTAAPGAGGSAPKFYFGLIRIGNGQAGFGTTVADLTPTVVPGLGDAATYSSGVTTRGEQDRVLVTKKGTVSMSINVVYGSGSKPPASVQDDLVATAKGVFVKLKA
jgi:hypothetical protein